MIFEIISQILLNNLSFTKYRSSRLSNFFKHFWYKFPAFFHKSGDFYFVEIIMT
jgi:hypothetical protein